MFSLFCICAVDAALIALVNSLFSCPLVEWQNICNKLLLVGLSLTAVSCSFC